jgi:hypothetical protein
MNTKKVYQYDSAGLYVGETLADESPLEPGVYLLPARTVEKAPLTEWPADKWPRYNGSDWVLVNKPVPAAANDNADPLVKLAAFLQANPDVAELVNNQGGV